jgi:hypothetical protein
MEIFTNGMIHADNIPSRIIKTNIKSYTPDMKLKHHLKLIGLPTTLALALVSTTAMAGTEAVTAPAPVASTSCLDWITVSGYAAVAYTYVDDGTDSFADGGTPFDAVKVGFEGSQGPVGGYASLFYTPGADDEAGILDAFLTYKAGNFTITGGKYLSYLGYEAFDTVNMMQLTYANGMGAIPAYHNGIKVDYSTDVFGAGFNISDSIRGGDGFWTGDEEFSDDQGYEGYVVYKGVEKLTVWAGFAYENTDDLGLEDFVTYDLWASYDLTDKLTIAGEIAYHDSGPNGFAGLGLLKYAFTDKFSTVLRFGIDEYKSGGSDTYRYTFAPTYAFCESFLVRGEVTFSDTFEDGDTVFSGIQAVAKF